MPSSAAASRSRSRAAAARRRAATALAVGDRPQRRRPGPEPTRRSGRREFVAERVADPEARHRVRLGERAHDHHALTRGRAAVAGSSSGPNSASASSTISHTGSSSPAGERGDVDQLAGRVVRAADDQRVRPGGAQRVQRWLDRHGRAARLVDQPRQMTPAGPGDRDLAAREPAEAPRAAARRRRGRPRPARARRRGARRSPRAAAPRPGTRSPRAAARTSPR